MSTGVGLGLGAIGGVASSLLGGSGDKEASSSTQSTPWAWAQPYITGENGITGVMPSAVSLYNQYAQPTDWQYDTNLANFGMNSNRVGVNDPANTYGSMLQNTVPQVSSGLLTGSNNANVSPVSNIAGVSPLSAQNVGYQTVSSQSVTPQRVAAQSVDLNAARASQGVLDPTSSLQKLLTGQIDNQYLSGMQQAATQTAQTQYNDNLTAADQNLQKALGSVRSGAIGAGQYGSSRQGIAEGQAIGQTQQQLSQNARDIAQASINAGSNLYGNAYENAQGRMYNTATGLNTQAADNATNNANRTLTADLANQSTDLNAQTGNANRSLTAGMANQSTALTADTGNANRALQADTTNNQNSLNTQQFNANLGLNNNSQAMQQSTNNLANYLGGMNISGQGLNQINGINTMQDTAYNNMFNDFAYPANWSWNQLNNYNNVIRGYATVGGTNQGNQTQQGSSNPVSSGLGGAATGAGISSLLGGSSGSGSGSYGYSGLYTPSQSMSAWGNPISGLLGY